MTERHLLLDFGGVISVTPFETHPRSEELLGLARGSIDWYGPFAPEKDELWSRMCRDEISERDYWATRARELGRRVGAEWSTRDMLLATRGRNINEHIRPEAETAIREARAMGAGVGILSNELELFYGAEAMSSLDVLRDIDFIVDGTHTRVLKPDPRAYQLALERFGVEADQVVFVDDQRRNVDGAAAAGLRAVWFDVTNPAACFRRAMDMLAEGAETRIRSRIS